MIEWIIILGLAVALYVIVYKYERKIDKLHDMVKENKEKIVSNENKIQDHHSKIEEHYNHIEKLWVHIPEKEDKSEKKE